MNLLLSWLKVKREDEFFKLKYQIINRR